MKQDHDGQQTPPVRSIWKKLLRFARIAATIVIAVVAVFLGIRAFAFYEQSPWTRDGRVSAYVVNSAAEVPGLVVRVPVHDNQFIRKGELIYSIDSRDYESALKIAAADLNAAQARLALQKANCERRERVAEGVISSEERQIYKVNVQVDEANVESARAALYRAQINLARCKVHSPVNGYVTNLTVREGNYASAGERQMSIVDADSYWITGYFEETRLRNVHVNAKAKAVLMGYSNVVIAGHVESLNRGIADTNTAPNPQGLPQVDPVFTWVRLAQRIPVRIHIDQVPDGVHLAIGETCTIHVE